MMDVSLPLAVNSPVLQRRPTFPSLNSATYLGEREKTGQESSITNFSLSDAAETRPPRHGKQREASPIILMAAEAAETFPGDVSMQTLPHTGPFSAKGTRNTARYREQQRELN